MWQILAKRDAPESGWGDVALTDDKLVVDDVWSGDVILIEHPISKYFFFCIVENTQFTQIT